MRKIYGIATALLGLSISIGEGLAQTQSDVLDPQRTIIVPSQSSVYNQNSVNLPTAPQPNGQDIVRGSNGTSCQSSVSTNNPYLDIGVIGSDDVFDRQTQALYGRLVVPLGRKPKRIDCTRLYELEIARLSMELEMMKLGMPSPEQFAAADLGQPALIDLVEDEDEAPGLMVVGGTEKQPVVQDVKPMPVEVMPAVAVAPAPLPEKKMLPKPVARSSPPQKAKKNCKFFAQLGSFMTEPDARRAWQTANNRKPELLHGHTYSVSEFDNGAKKYFRLRTGPLSQEDAQIVCERIESDCLVVAQKM